jgi:hypothetical protein
MTAPQAVMGHHTQALPCRAHPLDQASGRHIGINYRLSYGCQRSNGWGLLALSVCGRSGRRATVAPADREVLEGEHLLSETAHGGIQANDSKP